MSSSENVGVSNLSASGNTATIGNPATIAGNVAGDALSVLLPDAVVAGGTLDVPFVGKIGAFGIFPSTDLADATFFGAKPVTGPVGTIPFTNSPFAVSLVGTYNSQGVEVGVGIAGKIPTPAGDVFMFMNAREGNLQTLLEDSKKTPDRPITLSMNFGAALSVTDLAARGVTVGTGGLAAPVVESFAQVGDLWAGAAYRASVTVRNGEITGLKLSGVDIPLDQLGAFLGQKVTNDVAPQPSVSSSVVRDPNSRAYQVGDGIGIPGAGNLVYRGVQSDGYHHVASRTSDYRVPASVGYDKDAIRSWAIAAVANGAIGREGLYGAPAVGDGRPASPVASAPYRTGDYIGTPYGQLVFKGVADDGYLHVQTRTRDYRVPTELGNDRDAIRGWVINAIEHGGIDRSTLYPNKVSATLNEGAAVVSSTGERQVVRTSDNRELVVTMQDRSPVVTSEGVEVLRLREGTTLAQAAELVASRASPVLGQGVLVADAPNQNASQIPSRNVEFPQIGAYS
jgi:hypothetical protein